MIWTVILDRGADREPLVFEHVTERRAGNRADALADLHSCCVVTDYDARTMTVCAADYYWQPAKKGA